MSLQPIISADALNIIYFYIDHLNNKKYDLSIIIKIINNYLNTKICNYCKFNSIYFNYFICNNCKFLYYYCTKCYNYINKKNIIFNKYDVICYNCIHKKINIF